MTSRRPPLGQHFLLDYRVLERIARVIPLSGKTVLEIGSGHGELTQHLAKHARKVVAVEFDPTLVEALQEKSWKNVEVLHTDAREFDFSPYRYFFGNLPYYASTPLLLKVLSTSFEHAVFLVQEEFGKRMIAPAADSQYSRLSVAVQSRASCEITEYVPRERFTPEPRVDSVVVHLRALPEEKKTHYDEQLVSAAFCHKNQTLENALVHSASMLAMGKKEAKERVREKLAQWRARKVRAVHVKEWGEISLAWNAK